MLVNFNSHEYPWFWPFSFPIMKLHYDIKLEVVDTPQGKKFATQVGVQDFSASCALCFQVTVTLQSPGKACTAFITLNTWH